MKFIAGISLLIILQSVASQGQVANIPNCAVINTSTGLCDACANRYYLQLDKRACLPCNNTCLTCANSLPTTCTSCDTGRYFVSNTCPSCITGCDICTSDNTCNVCIRGYFKFGVACYACLAGCALCSNNTQCTRCSPTHTKRTVNGVDVCEMRSGGAWLIILWILIIMCCLACCIGACVWCLCNKSRRVVHGSDLNSHRNPEMYGPGVTDIYYDQSPPPAYHENQHGHGMPPPAYYNN